MQISRKLQTSSLLRLEFLCLCCTALSINNTGSVQHLIVVYRVVRSEIMILVNMEKKHISYRCSMIRRGQLSFDEYENLDLQSKVRTTLRQRQATHIIVGFMQSFLYTVYKVSDIIINIFTSLQSVCFPRPPPERVC